MTARAREQPANAMRRLGIYQPPPHRWGAAFWLAVVIATAGGAGYWLGHAESRPAPARAHDISEGRDERIDLIIAGQSDLRDRLSRLESRIPASDGTTAQVRAPTAAPAAAPALSDEPEESQPSSETIAARDSARAILDQAVQSGHWTQGHRDRMRQAFGAIGDDGRKAILRDLSVAINSGKLSLAGLEGPAL